MLRKLVQLCLVASAACVLNGCGDGSDSIANASGIKGAAISSETAVSSNVASDTVSITTFGPDSEEKFATSVLRGNADRTTIWPTNKIRVCYDVSKPDFLASEWHRSIIRAVVADTWEANSRIQFTGWEICPDRDDDWFIGIKISFVNGKPQTPLGIYSHGIGMALNPNYNFYYNERCSKNIKPCLEFDTVHEFGHALGFSHEHNRVVTPDDCKEEKDKIFIGNDPIGDWDEYSIMNYCNPNYQKEGAAVLSPTDVEMVQKYYGKPNEIAYVAKYATGATIGAFNVKSGVLRYPYVGGASGLPSQNRPRLLHIMKSSADGQRVYIAVSDVEGGDEALRVIDTPTNTIVATKMIQEKIIDLHGSPDGKSIYVLYKSLTGEGGIRTYGAQSFDIVSDVPLPGAKFLARPRVSSKFAYVLAESTASGQQTVSEVEVASGAITRVFPAGAFGKHGKGITLSPNEKELYFITHAVAGDDVPQLTGVNLPTGKALLLRNLPSGTDVTEIELIDTSRVLMGTNTRGMSPSIYDLGSFTTIPLLEPQSIPFSFPYISSPDGKTIFSMYKERISGQSYFSLVRFDVEYGSGKYVDDDLGMIAYEVDNGVLDRPFTIAYPN